MQRGEREVGEEERKAEKCRGGENLQTWQAI